MRSLTEAAAAFAYRPATPETAATHAAVRTVFSDALAQLWDLVPDGPDKTLVVRGLQSTMALAHTAIAMTAPVAAPGTAGIARVMPTDIDGAMPTDTPDGGLFCEDGVYRDALTGAPLGGLPAGDTEGRTLAEGCADCFLPCTAACRVLG